MEKSQSKKQFPSLLELLATFVKLSFLLVGLNFLINKLQISSDAIGRLIGHFDASLQNAGWKAVSGQARKPQSVFPVAGVFSFSSVTRSRLSSIKLSVLNDGLQLRHPTQT